VELVGLADGGSHLVWITDVLPDELGPIMDGLMAQGAEAMTAALSSAEVLDGP
jgi:hypothetical protein